MSRLHLIVEGEGDAQAVPVLVRKILSAHALDHVQLTRPQISGDIHKVFKRLADFVGYGLKNACPILWVLDCDDKADGTVGCPKRHVANLRAAIEQLLGKDRGYKESIDQAKLAARLDLSTCRAISRDYRHFEDAVLRLCKPQ